MTRYGKEIKAKAIAAHAAGEKYGEIAVRMKIPEGTIKAWISREKNAGTSVMDGLSEKERKQVGSLLVEAISESIKSQREIVRTFQDHEYCRTQDGKVLAVAFAILTDKTVQLLATLSPEADEGEGRDDENNDGGDLETPAGAADPGPTE